MKKNFGSKFIKFFQKIYIILALFPLLFIFSVIILIKGLDMALCLTAVQCNKGDPEYGQQKSDVCHSISYKVQTYRDVGRISLTSEKIGNDTNLNIICNLMLFLWILIIVKKISLIFFIEKSK